MKLELKHLAPYLPYGLKILYHGDKRKMNAGNGSSTNWIGITATLQRQSENCKPILRPLSDLTKEIEVNGERFVPIVKLAKIAVDNRFRIYAITNTSFEKGDAYAHFDCEDNISLSFWYLTKMKMFVVKINGTIHYRQFDLFEKLFEWHFDVFGLIENGLAIDVNTLNEQK